MAIISLLQTFQNTITKQLANIEKNVPLDQCPDNYVGSATIVNNSVKSSNLWFCHNLRINNHHIVSERIGLEGSKKSYKIIVIILESPHIDEYDKAKCKIAPAPALGTTGCNLDDGFVDTLNDFMTTNEGMIEDSIYKVILMNAVQFQCSLGLEPIVGKIRDENFLSLWASDAIVQNFKERLEKYQPDIVINCCTNGNITRSMVDKIFKNRQKGWAFIKYNQILLDITGHNKYFLYGFVQNVIYELFSGDKVKKLRSAHPSSWVRNKKNAKITKYE